MKKGRRDSRRVGKDVMVRTLHHRSIKEIVNITQICMSLTQVIRPYPSLTGQPYLSVSGQEFFLWSKNKASCMCLMH